MPTDHPVRQRASHATFTPMIKVCGVTREQDLRLLPQAGVTAVGLNFVPASPRCLSLGAGTELAAVARELGVVVVAVVRNAAVDELAGLLTDVSVDFLQLHGDESPHVLEELQACLPLRTPRIIRAISWSGRDDEVEFARQWFDYANAHPEHFAAWLVDAYAPAAGGGTGKLADWSRLTPRPEWLANFPLILAGGLGPHNVAQGIQRVRPDGVDTASGVEASPGIKLGSLVVDFAREARLAFEAASGNS